MNFPIKMFFIYFFHQDAHIALEIKTILEKKYYIPANWIVLLEKECPVYNKEGFVICTDKKLRLVFKEKKSLKFLKVFKDE